MADCARRLGVPSEIDGFAASWIPQLNVLPKVGLLVNAPDVVGTRRKKWGIFMDEIVRYWIPIVVGMIWMVWMNGSWLVMLVGLDCVQALDRGAELCAGINAARWYASVILAKTAGRSRYMMVHL